MSIQTKHRYLNSFFLTTILYLVASFFLFYVFADTLVIEEKKPEEVKISIKHMMTQQEPTPAQPVSEPISEITPPEPVVEKKIDRPRKEKKHENKHVKHEHKRPMKEPMVNKVQEIVETKNEVVTNVQPIQKNSSEEVVKQQIDTVQTESIEASYLSKIRHQIEKNKTYPKTAKRLNQSGKVYVVTPEKPNEVLI